MTAILKAMKQEKNKFRRFLLWLVTGLVVAAAAFMVWFFVIKSKNRTYTTPLTPVRVIQPYVADIEETIELTGYIEAQAMIPVVPFVPGTIKESLVKAGQYVEEGQLMAVVDPEPYALQAKQAEAVYLAAQSTFERVSSLYESGAATRQNYDEVKAQYDAYKAQYELAMLQLGYANITAPVSGTILIADGAEGSVAVNTTYLFVIADLDKLEVNLNVPENYYSIISANIDNLVGKVTKDGQTSFCEVDSVAPYISPTSKTFEVKLKLTDNPSAFKPGMFVKVELIYNTMEDVYVLPTSVANTDGSVYTYDPQTGTAVYTELEMEHTDGKVFAVDGSCADMYFICEGQSMVLDGQRVNVL